jgi:hypothetical protein
MSQQAGQRRPVYIAAETSVVVLFGQSRPSLLALAHDIGFSSFPCATRDLNSCCKPSSVDFRL